MTFCCDEEEMFVAGNSRRGHCPDEFLPNKTVSDTKVSVEVFIKANRRWRRMTVIKQISSNYLNLFTGVIVLVFKSPAR